MSELHIVPTGDLVAHEPNDGCVCGPGTEFVDGGQVVTHHSLDGREALDRRYELGLLTFTEYTQAAKALRP